MRGHLHYNELTPIVDGSDVHRASGLLLGRTRLLLGLDYQHVHWNDTDSFTWSRS